MHIPRYSELDEVQKKIQFLPLNGIFLVTGPPGTGKTVLAVCRHELLLKDNREPTLITKSKLLKQYMAVPDVEDDQIDITLTKVNVLTFDSWLGKFWWRHFRKFISQMAQRQINRGYDYDWDKMTEMMDERGIIDDLETDLIIDEGQDLAGDFYIFLDHIKPNLTVFADDNQSLADHPVTVAELKIILGVEKVYEVKKNYRNTREIANVAKRFFTGTASMYPDVPDRSGDPPEYRTYASEDALLERIKIRALNDETSDIGVFLPDVASVLDFKRKLTDKFSNTGTRRDSNPPQLYINERDAAKLGIEVPSIDFSKGHILICTYNSAKGLEFDSVFIPALQKLEMPRFNLNDDDTRRYFYVLTSRARTFLELGHYGEDTQITRELRNEVDQANP